MKHRPVGEDGSELDVDVRPDRGHNGPQEVGISPASKDPTYPYKISTSANPGRLSPRVSSAQFERRVVARAALRVLGQFISQPSRRATTIMTRAKHQCSISGPNHRPPTRSTTHQSASSGPLVQVPSRACRYRLWRCVACRPCRLAIQPRHRRLQEGDRLSLRSAHESSGGPVPRGRGTCWRTSWNSSVLFHTSCESLRPYMDIQGRSGGRGCGCHFPPAISPGVVSRLLSEQGSSQPERRHLPIDQSSRWSEAASVGRMRCDIGRSSSNNVELPAETDEDNGHSWHRSRTVWIGLSAALECARRHHICFTSSPHFLGCGNWHLVGR